MMQFSKLDQLFSPGKQAKCFVKKLAVPCFTKCFFMKNLFGRIESTFGVVLNFTQNVDNSKIASKLQNIF